MVLHIDKNNRKLKVFYYENVTREQLIGGIGSKSKIHLQNKKFPNLIEMLNIYVTFTNKKY